MREIEFRVFHKLFKKMCSVFSFCPDFVKVDLWDDGDIVKMHRADFGELIQYTGLKDKNGVKIFEGDVLEFDYNTFKVLYVVKYNQDVCSFMLYETGNNCDESFILSTHKAQKAKIIGNIYQNPELLPK